MFVFLFVCLILISMNKYCFYKTKIIIKSNNLCKIDIINKIILILFFNKKNSQSKSDFHPIFHLINTTVIIIFKTTIIKHQALVLKHLSQKSTKILLLRKQYHVVFVYKRYLLLSTLVTKINVDKINWEIKKALKYKEVVVH